MTKEEQSKKTQEYWVVRGYSLGMARGDLTDKVTFELRPERIKRISQADG